MLQLVSLTRDCSIDKKSVLLDRFEILGYHFCRILVHTKLRIFKEPKEQIG